jgi:hypothetical protein
MMQNAAFIIPVLFSFFTPHSLPFLKMNVSLKVAIQAHSLSTEELRWFGKKMSFI